MPVRKVSELFEGYNNLTQFQSPEIDIEYMVREHFGQQAGHLQVKK